MSNLGSLYANGQGVAQDYTKARELFQKAADEGEAIGMTNLGLLYENGQGVAQDYAKARELYEKAAKLGEANAMAKVPISKAGAAGPDAMVLQMRELMVRLAEDEETKREGKPGPKTALALESLARTALQAKDFTKALILADRAHALLPDGLAIEAIRAHTLMFMGYDEDAKALYLAHKGEVFKPDNKPDNKLWESDIAEDFADFRKAGLTSPMMADIEKELGISR
jgi:TPR repeat protein